ncbi:MAG: hypothetical protein JWM32_2079 [Verrucomicrobia bacterium]|nr:hypothetical protein [Verrucomicrobiota bacterium]
MDDLLASIDWIARQYKFQRKRVAIMGDGLEVISLCRS